MSEVKIAYNRETKVANILSGSDAPEGSEVIGSLNVGALGLSSPQDLSHQHVFDLLRRKGIHDQAGVTVERQPMEINDELEPGQTFAEQAQAADDGAGNDLDAGLAGSNPDEPESTADGSGPAGQTSTVTTTNSDGGQDSNQAGGGNANGANTNTAEGAGSTNGGDQTAELALGDSIDLVEGSTKDMTFEVSDEKIVKLDRRNGKVTALAAGTATVSVKGKDGTANRVVITVRDPAATEGANGAGSDAKEAGTTTV